MHVKISRSSSEIFRMIYDIIFIFKITATLFPECAAIKNETKQKILCRL